MSIIVEQNEEIEDSTLVEQELAEATAAAEAEETTETVPEYELPSKFQDKTIEDVVKSYSELEKEFGRKNNEVGELRKLTNQLLEQELSKKDEPTKKVDFDSLVDDPETAINEAVANNPVLKKLQENLEQSQRDTAKNTFEGKHPDYLEVANSDEFKTFVQSNPLMLESYERAVNYDYKAADSLLTLYKQMNGVAAEKANETKQANKKRVLKDAAVEKSSSGTVSKKMFRSTDLIRMRNEDPDRFLAMGEEIRAAYAEGRVK